MIHKICKFLGNGKLSDQSKAARGTFTKFTILVKKDLIIFQLKSDTILNQDYHFEFVWVCVMMSI